MATSYFRPLVAAFACAAATGAFADETTTITITGRTAPTIGGFGEIPLARTPLQASGWSTRQLGEAGVATFDGLARFDASASDAYNAEGYWSFLTVRGFVLDNRYNYRRDGLPIDAETFIPLVNKERLELLKGITGIQAGTSAPGGLVNFVVKRPTGSMHEAALDWRQSNSWSGSVDWSERFGTDNAFGLRVNAELAQLRPRTHDAEGSQRALALAADWQIVADSRIEFEFETSTRSQPSVPGFSLLGNRVPDAKSIDPRINLNHQPWVLPVMLAGDTASLRWQQRLAANWLLVAHAGTQRLRSDDRTAFPYGCSAEGNFDRFCSDGSFDVYDFRSEGERRRIDALDVHLEGTLDTGPLRHRATAGIMTSRERDRFGAQIFNLAGIGSIDGGLPPTPPATDPQTPGTNRDERSTEAYLRDVVALGADWDLWAGLRHTSIRRSTAGSDGSNPTAWSDAFTTPWLALSYRFDDTLMAYASWGQGIESTQVPDQPIFTNQGQAFSQRSRQVETGVKFASDGLDANVALFEIRRPMTADLCPGGLCTRVIDGVQRHRGIEAATTWRTGRWQLQASAMHLAAAREDAADASVNGQRPPNVPADTLRVHASWLAGGGVALDGGVVHDSGRVVVLPDATYGIPGWTRLDLGARLTTAWGGQTQTWRLGVDNATDRRAWREMPYEFGHVYLFPLQARTWRASLVSSF